jgi:hypothetical protein
MERFDLWLSSLCSLQVSTRTNEMLFLFQSDLRRFARAGDRRKEMQLTVVIEGEQTVDAQTNRNDSLLGVPVTAVNSPTIIHIDELGSDAPSQPELFFESYNRAHRRKFLALHRRGPAARELVVKAAARYAKESSP